MRRQLSRLFSLSCPAKRSMHNTQSLYQGLRANGAIGIGDSGERKAAFQKRCKFAKSVVTERGLAWIPNMFNDSLMMATKKWICEAVPANRPYTNFWGQMDDYFRLHRSRLNTCPLFRNRDFQTLKQAALSSLKGPIAFEAARAYRCYEPTNLYKDVSTPHQFINIMVFANDTPAWALEFSYPNPVSLPSLFRAGDVILFDGSVDRKFLMTTDEAALLLPELPKSILFRYAVKQAEAELLSSL